MFLSQLFQEMDTDGSGTISAGDMKALVEKAGAQEYVSDDRIDEFFANADQSGDGKISIEEFFQAIIEGP